jgi:uncharacterized protein (TIGR03435 family)
MPSEVVLAFVTLNALVVQEAKPDLERVSFDAASIKLSDPRSVRGTGGGPGTADPGRYFYNRATIENLVSEAYGFDSFQISSRVPLDRDRFDIVVKVAPGTSKHEFRSMFRTLLADRFHLQVHEETKEFSSYELVKLKGGLRISESALDATSRSRQATSTKDEFPELPPGRLSGIVTKNSVDGPFIVVRLRARQASISALASMLSSPGEPSIVDGTGIQGKFDFTLEYTTSRPGASNDDVSPRAVPDLLDAVQQQLGLQLVHRRIPLSVLVVDSVSRLPTEN